MHIRNIRSRDLKTCLNLDHSVVTEYAWRMEERGSDGMIRVFFQPVRLPRSVELPYPRRGEELAAGWREGDLFRVAVEGGRIRGYVTARALSGHGLAWVQDLVVGREWRRRGIGRHLFHEMVGWASEQGLRRVIVEVQTRNHPGVCFCRALGLSFCGYNDRHWRTRDIALLFGFDLR